MNAEKVNQSIVGEDTDSGLDNTSDSCLSCDEENDFISNSDNESNSSAENNDKNLVDQSNVKAPMNNTNATTFPVAVQHHNTDMRIELVNNDLISEEYREAAEFFRTLAVGNGEAVDFSTTPLQKKPEWLDEEKFKRGQKFARDFFFCINFTEMISLFVLFAQKASLGPLIFTGKSDSPYNAFRRYLSTVTKLMSWYNDDLWGEEENMGKKNMNTVRNMHKSVYYKLTNSSEKELRSKLTLGDPKTTAMWCPLKNLLQSDFRENIQENNEELNEFLEHREVWINQADMSITQFGFVGLAITYPTNFGIHLATEEDLDAFIHMWRGLGYLLGIKDQYNFCNGNLEIVRLRSKFFLETVAKPAFRDVTCDWEHMCRCLVSGIGFYIPRVNFESSLFFLCNVLEIDTPRLSRNLSFGNYLNYQTHKLVFYLMKYQGFLKFLNCKLNEAIKKAQNAPQEVLNKWEHKEFPYMNQKGKCPIRGQITSRNA